jgi:osmoprotectant transport system permease protein
VWATATIAALVAGPGLGRIVTLGFVRQDVPQVVGAAVVIAAIALLLELALFGLQRVLDPVSRAERFGRAVV